MTNKISIRKIFLAMAWVAVGSGLLTLLIAANRMKRVHTCKDVLITIKGTGENFFIDKGDIITLLKNGSPDKLVGRPLDKMNLAQMEKQLERSSWIADAELYIDGKDVLHVTALERQPIARVFTRAGNTFYIDSTGMRLPILQKLSVRVPVVTNFPSVRKLTARDSALLMDVKRLAVFITGNTFWNAQVGQIDIVGQNKFEIIPTVGNHIIKLGTAETLEQKFNKLFVFYRQVLAKTGFDKYAGIDLQYEGQVVGSYKGATSVVDSIQLAKNIEALMVSSQAEQQAQMPMAIDSVKVDTIIGLNKNDSSAIKKITEKPTSNHSGITKTTTAKTNPIPLKIAVTSKPIEKKKPTAKKSEVKKAEVKKPKAVMTKRSPI